MKTILMTAYDIDPYRGSESATGWNFVLQGARFNKVIAVTRENNQASIDSYIEKFRIDTTNIKFYYYDLPYYLRFWKKGARGSAIYFYLWQMWLPLFVKIRKIKFDIAHNVNFHADAFPTFLWVLGKPTVWGPINHNEKIPKEYLLSKKEFIKDRIKWIVKTVNWKLDPFLYLAKKRCAIIIGGNSSVQKRLSIPKEKFVQLTQVASSIQNDRNTNKDDKCFDVIIVGRFLTIKSFDIAILAFEDFYNNLSEQERKGVKLSIIGDGPIDLKEICLKLNSKNQIDFHGWVDKREMDSFYQKSNVFVFPSHEGAGMVVVEALANALPIVCFDNYGPGELVNERCSIKIPYSNRTESIINFSTAMKRLHGDKKMCLKKSIGSIDLFKDRYTWDSKGTILKEIYGNLKIYIKK
ncbi:MAG: glycosyltransferase family 4 protein [Bizionia sp.]|nr:glycosyltransferase family 4 protein [Bizionia sp.]